MVRRIKLQEFVAFDKFVLYVWGNIKIMKGKTFRFTEDQYGYFEEKGISKSMNDVLRRLLDKWIIEQKTEAKKIENLQPKGK